jgi:hypothetical protein
MVVKRSYYLEVLSLVANSRILYLVDPVIGGVLGLR